MTAWIALAAGTATAALGTTVAISAAVVGRIELTRWISRRLRGAAVASTLYSTPGRLLRTATALATAGVLTVGFALAALMQGGFNPLGYAALVLLVAVPALAVVAFGVPRAMGKRWSEAIVRRATPWGDRLASVLSLVLSVAEDGSAPTITGILKRQPGSDDYDPDEERVISGVMAFTEKTVREVMTPRTEIVAVEEGASMGEVARIFSESGYSRIPVYRDNLDDIVGMMYAFDLLQVTPGGELSVRPVVVTPGTNACAALLLEMQRERRQLAVVLDEFGGTAGIATLQDLLEELLGDVFDETDDIAVLEAHGPELVELDGATASSDVAMRFGVQLPGGAETIGGLLARKAGRIPQPGERLSLEGLEFDVLGASPTRIDRIAVRRGPVRCIALSTGNTK
jgi:CBS domain containing-hemolysin-like protein